MLLDAVEWQGIEAGLEQRARLLDLILRDLYGPNSQAWPVAAGIVIYAHAGYLRPLLGARPPERPY